MDANQAGNATTPPPPEVQQPLHGVQGPPDRLLHLDGPGPVPWSAAPPTRRRPRHLGPGRDHHRGRLGLVGVLDHRPVLSASRGGTCSSTATRPATPTTTPPPRSSSPSPWARAPRPSRFTSTAPAGAVVGGATYTPAATASSGLAVTITVDASASSVCTDHRRCRQLPGGGTCTLDANQAGNADYNAATQVQQSFAVGKGAETVTLHLDGTGRRGRGGATYTPAATATSGLAVTITVDASASSVCCDHRPASSASPGWAPASSTATRPATPTTTPRPRSSSPSPWARPPRPSRFTSTAPAGAVFGGATYTPAATATSGLAVTITVDASSSSVCCDHRRCRQLHRCGHLPPRRQPGRQRQLQRRGPGPAVLHRGQGLPDGHLHLDGTGLGGLRWRHLHAGGHFHLGPGRDHHRGRLGVLGVLRSPPVSSAYRSVGTCILDGNQAGNADYNAAAQVQQSFTVGKASQTVSFTSTAPAGAVLGGATYTPAATATSGLAVTITVDASASAVCCDHRRCLVSFTGGGHLPPRRQPGRQRRLQRRGPGPAVLHRGQGLPDHHAAPRRPRPAPPSAAPPTRRRPPPPRA